MKIAFVSLRFYPHIGGVETVVFQLATHLAQMGHSVTVLTQTNDKNYVKTEKINNFSVFRFYERGISELRLSLDLLNYLQKNASQFDIIHTHNYHAFPALAATLTKKTPLIFSPHYHGTGHTFFTYLLHYPYRLVGKYIFSRADAILCDTEAEAKLIRKHFSNSVTTEVIPLGIDVEGIRNAKKYATNMPYILTIGRLERYKNIALLIKSLQFVKSNLKLIIVGDGPEKETLMDLEKRFNLTNRIVFLENITNDKLFSLIKHAKVFVTMSRMEAYGLSLLEAAAAKLGIVASAIPSHTELIKRFEIKNIELLSPNVSPETLASSIEKALKTPSKTEKDLPSWKYVTEQTLRKYKEVIKKL